jgi:homogentisate 1,2-dioxygenase
MYRIRPSVLHSAFERIDSGRICSSWTDAIVDPNQLRWGPEPLLPKPSSSSSSFSSSSSSSSAAAAGAATDGVQAVDFVAGLATMAGGGDPNAKQGIAIHMYNFNSSMKDKAFSNADGDFLIVPETGALTVRTELGVLSVEPQEVVVVPRGIRFAVELANDETTPSARGYVLELYEGHFELPGLCGCPSQPLSSSGH